MLTLVGEQNRLCDRVSRRAFLKIGALGGLTLADVLRLEAGQPAAQANRKSVILIFLEGGASHLDTMTSSRRRPPKFAASSGPSAPACPGSTCVSSCPGRRKSRNT
jgi:hypothetical protein